MTPPDLRFRGRLPTGDDHELFFAEFGQAEGLAVLHLHGGPGSGANPGDADLFDLKRMRLILFDQRGTGDSTPAGDVTYNDTAHLLEDIERLRRHLGIDRWLIYGGSWGGTLALEYAKAHPQRVLGLVLRAPFLARASDLDWFIGREGAARTFPDDYATLRHALSAADDDDLVPRMHQWLFDAHTPATALARVCTAWSNWERALMGVEPRPMPADGPPDAALLQRQRIHVHYCRHGFFLGPDGVLPGVERIAHLPCRVVHGEQDRVCLPCASHELIARCPDWQLVNVADAGHGLDHPGLRQAVRDGLLAIAAATGTADFQSASGDR
jgi:proline iminopeptidase